jgi:serine O-acetyltransferase
MSDGTEARQKRLFEPRSHEVVWPPTTLSEVTAVIREDYATHRSDASKPGFRAVAVYRLDSWRLTIRSRSLRLPLTLVIRTAARWIRNHYTIELPPTAKIGRRFRIIHQGEIVIHRYARIGDDCLVLNGVTVGGVHGVSRDTAPVLGNRVEIGTGAKILGRVVIGDGAKIGPNAVVLSDVPAGATAFAPPARLIFSADAADATEQ